MAHQRVAGYSAPYKFTSKELDEQTGLYYFGARYYDPVASIWHGVDPMADKFPNISPYVYCANNPIIFFDPDGNILKFYGAKNNNARIEKIINAKLNGTGKFSIGSDGEAKFSGIKLNKMNKEQLALYNSLSKVIDSKATTSMASVGESDRNKVMGGSFTGNGAKVNGSPVQALDVTDIENFDKDMSDGVSAVGILTHEIVEAYMYQVQGAKKFEIAHAEALIAQGAVDGVENVSIVSINPSIMTSTYTKGINKMQTTYQLLKNNVTGKSKTEKTGSTLTLQFVVTDNNLR